jgi:hypothetical protein
MLFSVLPHLVPMTTLGMPGKLVQLELMALFWLLVNIFYALFLFFSGTLVTVIMYKFISVYHYYKQHRPDLRKQQM